MGAWPSPWERVGGAKGSLPHRGLARGTKRAEKVYVGGGLPTINTYSCVYLKRKPPSECWRLSSRRVLEPTQGVR